MLNYTFTYLLDGSHFVGCVQLYYRSNYHWYLKQQWTGTDMKLLSFDLEISNRIYLTESRQRNKSIEGTGNLGQRLCISCHVG